MPGIGPMPLRSDPWQIAHGIVAPEPPGRAERAAAEAMIVRHSPGARRLTLGADKGYDASAFVADLRALNVTPHIAQNLSGRRSAIDGRTTRHPGYAASQQKRKRIEEPFGWSKTIGGLARPMLRGARRLAFKFDGRLQSDPNTEAHRGAGLRIQPLRCPQRPSEARNMLERSTHTEYSTSSTRNSAAC
jgi:hypothetical protein